VSVTLLIMCYGHVANDLMKILYWFKRYVLQSFPAIDAYLKKTNVIYAIYTVILLSLQGGGYNKNVRRWGGFIRGFIRIRIRQLTMGAGWLAS
jgi:hypothetical protein